MEFVPLEARDLRLFSIKFGEVFRIALSGDIGMRTTKPGGNEVCQYVDLTTGHVGDAPEDFTVEIIKCKLVEIE